MSGWRLKSSPRNVEPERMKVVITIAFLFVYWVCRSLVVISLVTVTPGTSVWYQLPSSCVATSRMKNTTIEKCRKVLSCFIVLLMIRWFAKLGFVWLDSFKEWETSMSLNSHFNGNQKVKFIYVLLFSWDWGFCCYSNQDFIRTLLSGYPKGHKEF